MIFNKVVSKSKLIVFAFVVLNSLYSFHSSSFAQKSSSSPYSRYGIGDIAGKGFAQGFSMGGTHIAMQNDTTPVFFINYGNPASYSNVRLATAELGANYTRLNLTSATSKTTINNASLAYISMAFPIKN